MLYISNTSFLAHALPHTLQETTSARQLKMASTTTQPRNYDALNTTTRPSSPTAARQQESDVYSEKYLPPSTDLEGQQPAHRLVDSVLSKMSLLVKITCAYTILALILLIFYTKVPMPYIDGFHVLGFLGILYHLYQFNRSLKDMDEFFEGGGLDGETRPLLAAQ